MGTGEAFGLGPDPDGDFDATDPYSHPGFRRFAHKVRTELIPKIEDSEVVFSFIMEGQPDVKWAVEMGMSIMMDKPIVAIVSPGRHIPKKLAAVVDYWIEDHPDPDVVRQRIVEAMASMEGGDPR